MSNISLSKYGNIPLNTKLPTMRATPAAGNAFNNYSGQVTPGVSSYLPSNYSNNNNALTQSFTQPVYGGRQWDGTKLGPVGQVIVGSGASSNPQSEDSILNQYNDATNKAYENNLAAAQTQRDLTTNNLNTLNTQALGTQDQTARDAFLNQVYNPLMKQEGSLQYKYGLDTGNNDALYGLQSTANQQNRDLALSKLATDEQNNLAQLGLAHGNQNASTIDSLNSRGMLYGQVPTGMYQDQNIGGLHGLAGQQAGLVNQDYDIQRNQITQPYQLGVQGANQAYTQQQGLDTQNHLYSGQTAGYDAANNINNQNANYTFQTGMANNTLQMYKNQAAQQQGADQQANMLIAKKQAAQQNGITYQ